MKTGSAPSLSGEERGVAGGVAGGVVGGVAPSLSCVGGEGAASSSGAIPR
jgi:outer membrane lipoprotein SlyB